MTLNRSLIAGAITIMVLVSTPVWSAQQPVASKSLSVNQLAARPDAYVGKVAVVGRVTTSTPGKGFTMIDSVNCATCTTECLTDKATKKIPYRADAVVRRAEFNMAAIFALLGVG